jgi:hypothetical protein
MVSLPAWLGPAPAGSVDRSQCWAQSLHQAKATGRLVSLLLAPC